MKAKDTARLPAPSIHTSVQVLRPHALQHSSGGIKLQNVLITSFDTSSSSNGGGTNFPIKIKHNA